MIPYIFRDYNAPEAESRAALLERKLKFLREMRAGLQFKLSGISADIHSLEQQLLEQQALASSPAPSKTLTLR
ncbi:hypothetical protein [Leptolyngbya sp. FACHB-261]|uniref:hypothetical protein n=1 Tax=Leptolyngbya sp. FACHB-261 TaxID=2692806 RepID=UPI001689FE37|nr:hypothetical protein [Leptolyngbya sp. FACHB-261]MBD2099422.1 hypothetical protein [Leptolyngbya sp. FACHB-261]